ADRTEGAAVAVEAHEWTFAAAARAHQRFARLGASRLGRGAALLHGGAALLATRELVARAARQQARAPAAVEHADRAAVASHRGAQGVGQRRAQQAVTRFLVALVDDLHAWPRVRRWTDDVGADGDHRVDGWRGRQHAH